ncbi:hypothetical protein DICPUDRAFT_57081 [Dictyostelium purpureum]|uniref:Uncharacterized protein n=1 Tax=Dictyostelium purpureum TaxID=5786 RepID=F0ZU74_DICPU|nr:uncharacterized protein DICPUDRAFT_57081 [Dictyostelium purpureum]EGC32520.1 hypothetical protein DICPUDRAFT_57081 [Dictyostelium purpureum]|eukprot:XP_003290970.1 hypothetical protein DICPUDRAFT_57081 [Dictyostelium purpureum]
MSYTTTSIILASSNENQSVIKLKNNHDSIKTTTDNDEDITSTTIIINNDSNDSIDNNNSNNNNNNNGNNIYKLYSEIMSNENISKRIFYYIKKFDSKFISKKYKDILSLEWMIMYKHWGLIKDKVMNGQYMIISSVCKKVIFSIPDFELFKLVFERYNEYFPKQYPSLIDNATYYGNLDMVIYLHNRGYTATPYAIDNAARWGNLAMVKFLKENRSEGCTDSAMENAVAFNDFELVKYIHQQLYEPCTLFAIDHAASNGNLEILQYLHKNLGNTPSPNGANSSMNNGNGSGSVASPNSKEIMTSNTPPSTPKRSKALDLAAQYGHLECLKYLIQHNIIPPSHNGNREYPLLSPIGGNIRTSNVTMMQGDPHQDNPYYSATKQAIIGGHLDIVKYLFTLYQPTTVEVFVLSITKGQLDILNFYMEHLKNVDFETHFNNTYTEDYIASALHYKNLDLIKVCHKVLGIEITSKAFDIAVRFVDRPDLLVYLLQEKPLPDGGFSPNLLADCCIYNNLAAIKALVIFGGESFYLQPQSYCAGMEIASASGFIEIVQYLNELDQSLSIGAAVDKASINGHYNIVKYLTENRPTASCTTDAVDKAVYNGHEEVVKYLLLNRTEGATSKALNNAAYLGDLDLVMFLHKKGQQCSKAAINGAASNGYLDVIKFLQKNRTEGCTEQALINAISGNCLDTVKYIIEQYCPRDIQITEATMVAIGESGDLNTLKYFKEIVSRTVSVNLDFSHILKPAFNYGYLDIIKYCLSPSGSTTPRTPTSSSSPSYSPFNIPQLTSPLFLSSGNSNSSSSSSTPVSSQSPISSPILLSSSSSLQPVPQSSQQQQVTSPLALSSQSLNSSGNNITISSNTPSTTGSNNVLNNIIINNTLSTLLQSPLQLPLTKDLIQISYSRGHSHILEYFLEYHPKPLQKYLSGLDLSPRRRILKYDEYHLLSYLKTLNTKLNTKSKPTISILSKILPIRNKK